MKNIYKVLVVNVIVGCFCMGIVTGCSVKTNKKAIVNKEMTKTKEVISSGEILSTDKDLILEENLGHNFDSNNLSSLMQYLKPNVS